MPKRIEVDLNRQVLLAFDGTRQAFAFDCVTGDDTHRTPTGLWSVNRKHRFYVSRTYHARMDYAMFFTTTGEAIHQSSLVGPVSYLRYFGLTSAFGSHGCVRLTEADAGALFQWTPMGTPVWVH